MNVAFSLATFANVPAIPVCHCARLLHPIFFYALSRKPQKARLKEHKHIAEKERWSEKTLEWVSITLPYDWESCGLRMRQSGS